MINLKTILFEETDGKSSHYTVFFDMDGVLADFEKGTMQSHEVIEAKEKLDSILQGMPELANITEYELKNKLTGKQSDPKLVELKAAFREFNGARFKEADKEGFFENLEPMDGARMMLVKAREITGDLPNILTAPTEKNPDRCEKEKHNWMGKHFNGLFNEFICDKDKFHHASPHSILIDDREKYLNPFMDHGGIGILHKSPQKSMKMLEKIVSDSIR